MKESIAWETVCSDTILDCGPVRVIQDRVRFQDGTESDFQYISPPDTAVVLPIMDENRVVTIREWRQAVERTVTGLPGGSLTKEDTPEAAARRELNEETGYTADTIKHLRTVQVDNGISDGRHHHFVAYGCERTGTQSSEEGESIEVEIKPIDELISEAINGEISDARTLMGIFSLIVAQTDNPQALVDI